MNEEITRRDDEEEIIPVPGGLSPEKVAGDLEANRLHRNQVLSAPATPEQTEAQRIFFEEMRRRSDGGVVTMSAWQRRVALAHLQEEEALAGLRSLDVEHPEFRQRSDGYLLNLATALFVQGRFEEALEVCPLTYASERATYAEYLAAELRDDSDLCACESERHLRTLPINGQLAPVHIYEHPHFSEGRFPSTRRNCWVLAVRCSRCLHLNLRRELTPSAAAAEAARANPAPDAVALAAGQE